MLDRETVIQALSLCADNWVLRDAGLWAERLADLLLTYEAIQHAEAETVIQAVRAHIAEADRQPRARDILERVKAARPARSPSPSSSGAACSSCADGWIESQIRERCRDGVERLRKPLLVRCWDCRGGAGRGALVRGWEEQLRAGGGSLVSVEWGSPLLRARAPSPEPSQSSSSWRYTPNPEQHDPHRAERERRRQWAAEQLEADAIRQDAKRGGASMEALLRAERAGRSAA